VWADATASGLNAIFSSSIVWADSFTGTDERTAIMGEK
jgi:hypothetical protein